MKNIKLKIISMLIVMSMIATGIVPQAFAEAGKESGTPKINTEVLNSRYNAIDKDTDDDGLTDSDELNIGLNPENPKTFGTPDSKYISKQVISENNNSLSKINKKNSPYKISAEFESTGYVEGNLNSKKSDYLKAIKNNAILGTAFELECGDTCKISNIVLKFHVSNKYVDNDSDEFKNFSELKGLKRYVIFKYFEDSNMLLPIETKYDESENIVYTETDELGTYCIVDMQKMFVNLGYDEVIDRNSNISTADEIQTNYDVQTLLSESSERDSKISTPIDVVFMLQTEGSLSNDFQIQVDAIKKASKLLFAAYSDVRISIITYTPMGLMYFLTTDIGSSDGTNQRYLTTYEEVDAALDTAEYTYSIDTTNRAYPIRFMLNVVDFRENATKFAFQIANGKANCGNSIPNNHYNYIINCRDNNINYSEVIPSGYKCKSANEQIIISAAIKGTGGIEINSSNIAYMVIYNHISENTPEPQEYNVVIPTSWERITLIDKLNSNNGVNSDTDTLTDWEETDTESGIITWDDDGNIQLPTVQECLEQYSDKDYVKDVLDKYLSTVPADVWNMFLNEEILPIHSNPCNEDTDGDGLNDDEDFDPLNPLSENDKIIYNFFENAEGFEVRFVLENPWLQELGTIKGIKCVEIFRNHRTDRDPDVMREEMIAEGLLVEQEDDPFWQKFLQWLGGNYMNPAAMLYAEYELYEKDMSFSQILNDSWETWSNEMKVAIQIWFFGVSDLLQQNWEQWDYSYEYKLSLQKEQRLKEYIEINGTNGKNQGKDKLVVADSKFLNESGEVDWERYAPNDGFVEGTKVENQVLNSGTIIDRYGNNSGEYTSPLGTSYSQRSLPYIENPNAYHKYKVIKDIEGASMGEIAPAFDQIGGGTQYKLPNRIIDLINNGYLEEIL